MYDALDDMLDGDDDGDDFDDLLRDTAAEDAAKVGELNNHSIIQLYRYRPD